MSPPRAVGGLARVDHKAERVISRAEFLRDLLPWRLDEPADCVLVVPSLRLVLRVGNIVHVVLHFGAEVEKLVVPGCKVACLQVFLWRGLFAMIGEPVDRRIVPGCLAQPHNIPHAVGKRHVLPFR